MKISLNWLSDYIDINNIPVEEISNKLTMAGLEVESVINEKEIYKNFIVGLIQEKTKHPNADKLSVCKVSTGSEELQVICGAPNVEKGQKIVFAPIGTVIPKGSFKINKAKIRGVESFGMICSESELNLSDDHSGIMVLSQKLKEGTPITEALNLNDVIFEIGITPNRPDALSHIGVARDLAAIFNLELKIPSINLKESEKKAEDSASVEIEDKINCPRYSARIIENIEVKESPDWLKVRLKNIGLRPINNIVDVTNYVMYETGQPLHAFDLNMLSGKKIIVKNLGKESLFTTLDNKERKLPAGALMICDAEKPVAIAGVMGGFNSEINDNTKDILIESAHFNSSSIRRTSKAIGLSTEASYRFERGVDPEGTVFAAERAAELINKLAGGIILKGTIDTNPIKFQSPKITLRFERIKRLLGYEIYIENVKLIIQKLGLKILEINESEIKVSVPGFRPDIEREVDLIEEIARINGYDNIPAVSKINITLGQKTDESAFKDEIRNYLNGLGLYEMINNPLTNEKSAALTGNPIPILNPLSQDMAFMRTSLMPGALSVISHNIKVGEKNIFLYEIGNVFNKITSESIKSFEDFSETEKLIIIVSGNLSDKGWNSEEKLVDFYYLKGLTDSLLGKISNHEKVEEKYYINSENNLFELYSEKIYQNRVIGSGGKVKKNILKDFDIEQDVFSFEFSISELKNLRKREKKFTEPLKYPKVVRDFAFIFDKSVFYDEVIEYIGKEGSELLKSVKLFDLFESESLGKDKKSMAFSLEYFSKERTLTEEEVEREFLNLINAISKKFNAKLRGGN